MGPQAAEPGARARRDEPKASVPGLDLAERGSANALGRASDAAAGRIVRDNELAVAGHVHVELERIGAAFERQQERRQGVLGALGRRATMAPKAEIVL